MCIWKKAKVIWLVILFILIFGIIYISFLEKDYNKTYNEVSGEKTVEAIVVSEPENKDYKYTYTIMIEKIISNAEKNNNVLNTVKGKKFILDVKLKNQKYIPKFGDRIIINGIVEVPNSSRNYKGFDYRKYLKTKKIYGTVEGEKLYKVHENAVNIINRFVNYVQNNIKVTLNKILNYDEASLCIGILIGDRTNISEQIEDDFKESNLTHMLAVSGSHIAYIINGFAILLSKTNKKFSKIITIVFLIFFIILTGFTASVLRASFMGILVLLAGIFYKKSDTLNNLGISSFIILLINPYTIFDIGFILSFAGTLGIILFADVIYNYIYKMKIKNIISKIRNKNNVILKITENKVFKYIINCFSITLSANILIIPIMAYSFSSFSFTFWISNILAGPVMEIVTIYGFVVCFISVICFPFAKFIGIGLNFLLYILIKIAEITSIIPGASMYIKTPYLFSCVIYYLVIWFIFIKFNYQSCYIEKVKNKLASCNKIVTKNTIKIFIIILILITFFQNCIFKTIVCSSLKIYFIDVGQGDSTLIQTPFGKSILIDGGGSEFGEFDVGENVLLPYLLDRRITRINYMIISHFDSDHVKGLITVLKNLRVDNVIISKQGEISNNFREFQKIIQDKKIKLIIAKKGDYLKIDNLTHIHILFPEENLINDNILNNNSMVFKFVSNDFSMLFTGDIEKIAEERMIEIYQNTNMLNSDVLKAAHHGSKTSSINSFLELVKPSIALIGVGKDNNFGHPNIEVLNVLREYTNNILRTDELGEIIIECNGKKINIKKHIKN